MKNFSSFLSWNNRDEIRESLLLNENIIEDLISSSFQNFKLIF